MPTESQSDGVFNTLFKDNSGVYAPKQSKPPIIPRLTVKPKKDPVAEFTAYLQANGHEAAMTKYGPKGFLDLSAQAKERNLLTQKDLDAAVALGAQKRKDAATPVTGNSKAGDILYPTTKETPKAKETASTFAADAEKYGYRNALAYAWKKGDFVKPDENQYRGDTGAIDRKKYNEDLAEWTALTAKK